MSEPTNKALVKTESGEAVFKPFGAADNIKLSVSIVQNHVAVKTRSGKTCSTQDAIKFIALCRAQRLNPFAGDAFLVGYDTKDGFAKFSLITAQLAFIKRAETCPDYEGMESGIILINADGLVSEREGDFKLPEENCVGGWARVYRKGRKATYRRLSIAAMKPPYETPFWNDTKAPGQICKCAESQALRDTFPTLLGGLYTQGEVIDISTNASEPLQIPSSTLVATTSEAQAEREPDNGNQGAAAEPAQDSPRPSYPAPAVHKLTDALGKAAIPFTAFQNYVASEYPAMQADTWASLDDIRKADLAVLNRALPAIVEALGKKGEQ